MILQRKTRAPASPPLRLHPPVETLRETRPSRGGTVGADHRARDLVIGAISGYTFTDVQYWVNSLDRSGFSGEKVVIVYDASFETVDELIRREYRVVTFAEHQRKRRYCYPVKGFRHEDTSIDRFYQVWRYLRMHPGHYRYVVSVDVRDVVFQSDPSSWLEEHLDGMKINVGSEGIQVSHEPWNSEVILKCYGPIVHEHLSQLTSFNAGTIGGDADTLRDLSLNVFLSSYRNPITYTDQSALNILLSLEPYRSVTRFNRADEDWACQAATAADPVYRASHGSRLLSPPPLLRGDSVCTPSGSPYCLVHQYDRIPEWKEVLERKYST